MKNTSPKTLIIVANLILSTLLFVFIFIAKVYFKNDINNYLLFGAPVLLFCLGYGIYYYILEHFIYERIKLIYKIIYDLKSPKGSSKVRLQLERNIIQEVEEEVTYWLLSKKKESEQLKMMEDFRREFLGNISHELKTPIFNIQGYLETLMDEKLENKEVSLNFLQKAIKNVNRLNIIVEDLELISLREHGKLHLKKESFDIYKKVTEVFESMEIEAQKKGMQLKLKDDYSTPLNVTADKKRIHQVLINLIVNAIKYGKEGGSVTVGCFDMDENILIEVSDNGIGIDKRHLPRLFERFYRVDNSRSRKEGGSGLGLSIVKHIIEAHNQTINIRSTINVGSTFGFTLSKD